VKEYAVVGNVSGLSAIDFDSGTLQQGLGNVPNMRALTDWMRSTGVDALGVVSPPERGLMGFGLPIVPLSSAQWEIDPTELEKLLRGRGRKRRR
jgi:hypothetical protein